MRSYEPGTTRRRTIVTQARRGWSREVMARRDVSSAPGRWAWASSISSCSVAPHNTDARGAGAVQGRLPPGRRLLSARLSLAALGFARCLHPIQSQVLHAPSSGERMRPRQHSADQEAPDDADHSRANGSTSTPNTGGRRHVYALEGRAGLVLAPVTIYGRLQRRGACAEHAPRPACLIHARLPSKEELLFVKGLPRKRWTQGDTR